MGYERALKAINLEETDMFPETEFISHPKFVRVATGIDPYEHPQKAAIALIKKFEIDLSSVPFTDEPIPREMRWEDETFPGFREGHRVVRWGAGTTWRWNWGEEFKSFEQVLDFDPASIKVLPEDCGSVPLTESVEDLAEHFRRMHDAMQVAVGNLCLVPGHYYRTLFMWPLMTFGWKNFMNLVLREPRTFEKLLDKFAFISKKVFEAWSLTDIKILYSHDDLCSRQGPIFSPNFYRKYIFPWYKKLWAPVKKAGIKIWFVSDGNINEIIDDIFEAGADGVWMECYTDLGRIVDKWGDKKFIMGGLDGRVLMWGSKREIWAEVERVSKIVRDCPGYFYNNPHHITWDLSIENVFEYFKAVKEFRKRL